MKPIRIQRKRTKDWKKPENTINCTRPGKWGNPFKIIGDMVYLDISYRRKTISNGKYIGQAKDADVVAMFENLLKLDFSHDPDIDYWIKHFDSFDLNELKGKNLMCFCALDKPCHVDVLLKLANNED